MYIKNCKFWSNSVQLHREEIASVLPPRSKLYWASNRFSKINILFIIWRLEMDHMAQKYLVFKKCSILIDWWKRWKYDCSGKVRPVWLQRVAGSPEAKPDPQQIVQRGKDRRATLLQKSGSRVSNVFAAAPQVREIYENTWNICWRGSSWRLGDRRRPRFHPRRWFGRRRVSDILQDSRRAGLNYPSLDSLLNNSLPWFPFKWFSSMVGFLVKHWKCLNGGQVGNF